MLCLQGRVCAFTENQAEVERRVQPETGTAGLPRIDDRLRAIAAMD